jgi:hypothetical protein
MESYLDAARKLRVDYDIIAAADDYDRSRIGRSNYMEVRAKWVTRPRRFGPQASYACVATQREGTRG